MGETQVVAMRIIGAGLAIAALLAGSVACGGGDDDGTGEGGSTARREIQAEAQERAESLNLTLSDFPDGWRMSEADEDEEDDEDDEFLACVGIDLAAITIIGDANSDDFARGETAEVSSESSVFKSEQMATDALAEAAAGYEREEADACLNELIPDPGAEFDFGELEMGPLSFTPPSGVDEAQAWQIAIPIEGAPGKGQEGVAVTLYADMVALREGDAIVLVQAFDLFSPFNTQLRDLLLKTIAGRMVG
jgi:hypothetical protein